ncbi:MAG: glyceraldehyde-3-phosphate dehydrogenase 1 [Thelocarpon impressellum]|nr:MAG: glyceraldehyde-3-phosphate dehydrogenase 1 [Thelocarpon impressellum]
MNQQHHRNALKGGVFRDVVDSFKRDPNARVVPQGFMRADDGPWDLEDAYEATARSPLARSLKGRHLQMIAIGGAIGAGLFINSGRLLHIAGPASLLIAFAIMGISVFCTTHALGEMAVLFPIAGSFSAYSTRFLDPAWGFAMGWNYALQWLSLIPLEIVAATIAVNYWTDGTPSNAIWITVYLIVLVLFNCLNVKAYGEAEFVLTMVKIIAILGFVIFALVIDLGGGPKREFIGGRYWRDPGAFVNGFKGLCSVITTAALAFEGSELVGLCSAETKYPRQSIPAAVRQTFWRLIFFYLVSLLMVGLIVRHDDPQLLASKVAVGDTSASPFVIAITNAGVGGLDSVMNAVILLACFEVSNSAVYASTRTMAALAEQRQAPAFLSYIDRQGRPMAAIVVALAIGLLSYLGAQSSASQIDVLTWFVAISGLSGIFTWASICLCHIRFRRAWKRQGHSLDELAFRSVVGVAGSWFALVAFIILLALQFWVAVWPIDYGEMSARKRARSFFQGYLAVPIVIGFYVTYKLMYRPQIVRSDNMNLSIGVLKLTLEQIREEERAKASREPWWRIRLPKARVTRVLRSRADTADDAEWDYPYPGTKR